MSGILFFIFASCEPLSYLLCKGEVKLFLTKVISSTDSQFLALLARIPCKIKVLYYYFFFEKKETENISCVFNVSTQREVLKSKITSFSQKMCPNNNSSASNFKLIIWKAYKAETQAKLKKCTQQRRQANTQIVCAQRDVVKGQITSIPPKIWTNNNSSASNTIPNKDI